MRASDSVSAAEKGVAANVHLTSKNFCILAHAQGGTLLEARSCYPRAGSEDFLCDPTRDFLNPLNSRQVRHSLLQGIVQNSSSSPAANQLPWIDGPLASCQRGSGSPAFVAAPLREGL